MKNMTRILVGAGCLALTGLAQADVVGASAGFTYWASDASGSVSKDGGEVGLDDDLGLDSEEFTIASVALEHPVPLLPNVRLQYFNMDQSADGRIPLGTTYDGLTGPVTTDLDLTHYDVTLYYELLDDGLNLDVGLTAKLFDGELRIADDLGRTSKTDISEVLPMLYGHAQVDLPFSGLAVGAGGNVISFDGDTVYDLAGYLSYSVAVLNVRAGYRAMGVKVDDMDGADVDAKLQGPYLRLGVDF